jgi:hypothetical protein
MRTHAVPQIVKYEINSRKKYPLPVMAFSQSANGRAYWAKQNRALLKQVVGRG